MVKKRILSAAVAVAVMTTGAVSFEANTDGQIWNKGFTLSGAYDGGVVAAPALKLSATQKGDALIFPAFRTEITDLTIKKRQGWETEAVIRNNSDKAVVVKIAFHGAEDSEEVFDFQIYLSGHDAFRFTSEDGKLITTDGSVFNHLTGKMNLDGNRYAITPSALSIDSGYFTAIAMMEADNDYHEDRQVIIDGKSALVRGHDDLYNDYKQVVLECRSGAWESRSIAGGISDGVIVYYTDALITQLNGGQTTVSSPNVSETCDTPATKIRTADFFDPRPEVLMGTVRLSNNLNDKRDLIIPATAISNVTDTADVAVGDNITTNRPDQRDDGIMLAYIPEELALIADRNILDNHYLEAKVQEDAQTFLVSYADYTYENTAVKVGAEDIKVQNTLLATQVLKRLLIQLGNHDDYWTLTGTYAEGKGTFGTEFTYSLWDEAEHNCIEGNVTNGNITASSNGEYSPGNNMPEAVGKACKYTWENEVTGMTNLQDLALGDYFSKESISGFAKIPFNRTPSSIAGNGIPAIVTQMIGTGVDDMAQTNWIYASVDRPVVAKEKTTYFNSSDAVADDNIKISLGYRNLNNNTVDLRNIQNERDVLVTAQ